MNKKKTARIIVFSLLIFIGGLATGLLSVPMLDRYFMRPPKPEDMSRHILSMLQSRLALTPEQSAQIKPIVDKAGADMQTIWFETTNRVAARMEATDSEIALLLTPEQKPKLDVFAAERRERMRKRTLFPPRPR